MKIAILGTKGIPGRHGVETVVDALCPHLTTMGHDITIYGYDSYTSSTEDCHGVKIQTVSGSPSKHLEMITHMWNASKCASDEFFDLVHIHSVDPCLLAWLPKVRYGVVATSHGQSYKRNKWGYVAKIASMVAERLFIHVPDVITSVSKPLADFYAKKYNKHVLYIPNGIEIRENPSESFLKKWNLEPQKFFFSSAGRIERTKGIHTLINAYELLETSFPLVIAGGGKGTDMKFYNELKKSCPEGVRFIGFLSGDEYFAMFAHAKIFIFPSEYEAMSIALLEGLASGTPCLYSNIPENNTIAETLGYSFLPSDVTSLVEQWRHMLSHYDEAVEKASHAKIAINKRHNWNSIAKQYNNIYTSFLS